MYQPRFSLLIGLLAYSVVIRLAPYLLHQFGMSIDPETTVYPWNFSPLPALCLFGAVYFTDRRWSYLMPVAALLLGDLAIGAITGQWDWAFYPGQAFVYAGFGVTVTWGFLLRRHQSVWAIGGTGLLASAAFFLISNFGVWATGNGAMYPHTWDGLATCYMMALPFFRNSVISMVLFSGILFSRIALVERELLKQPPVPLLQAE